jgi:hypothetical protein
MQVEFRFGEKKTILQNHPPAWRWFFPLTHLFGPVVSDLASENSEPLTSLASVLKKTYSHP